MGRTPSITKPVKKAAAKAAPAEKVVAVTALGCVACDNTGLNSRGIDAQACAECNGSPFGEPGAEVQVDVAKEAADV